jgi:hypothetical protein
MEWERGLIFEGLKCITAREWERERDFLNTIIDMYKFVLSTVFFDR